MSPSFALLVLAETTKLFSRPIARAGLLISALFGLGLPLMLLWLVNSGMEINGVASESYFDGTATRPLVWALHIRNFLVIRAFLVMLGAQSIAGELGARTLREDLLRPVHRWQVLGAKGSALILWDAASLLLTFVFTAVPSLLVLGTSGPWLHVMGAFALNVLADMGVIAVILALAALTRSLAATIAGALVGFVLDWMVGWSMYLAGQGAKAFGGSPALIAVLDQWPALPTYAFSVWTFALPEAEINVVSIASLVAITASALLIAGWRLDRMEVP